MEIDNIRRLLIVGAGTMGQQIGLQCAMYGYDVVLYDLAAKHLEAAMAQVKTYLTQLVGAGYLSQEAALAALERITPTDDPKLAAVEIDLLSESVPEDPELKGKVLAQFNALCPARTIFTTNTSMLIPSMFAEASGRPAQFAAFHFHQPVWLSNVVDVMPHSGTAPETTDLLLQFARRIGQIPIYLKKENHGYVFNTLLSAVNREAITLVANGIASVADIDRAWMGVMKTQIGPFGIMDVIGLDTVWEITNYWAGQLEDQPQLRTNADFLKTYLDKGRLGVKSQQGFYTYPNPSYQQPGFVKGDPEPPQ